jgi:hypothetical protein
MIRSLNTIANDIRKDWTKPNYAAVPYLDAMLHLDTIHDSYYYDNASDIVRYFLSNATSWKGETARAIKAELKSMLKVECEYIQGKGTNDA